VPGFSRPSISGPIPVLARRTTDAPIAAATQAGDLARGLEQNESALVEAVNTLLPRDDRDLFVLIVGLTLGIIWLFGRANRRLNRHLPQAARPRFRFRPQYVR
jgi:hypothetical protein